MGGRSAGALVFVLGFGICLDPCRQATPNTAFFLASKPQVIYNGIYLILLSVISVVYFMTSYFFLVSTAVEMIGYGLILAGSVMLAHFAQTHFVIDAPRPINRGLMRAKRGVAAVILGLCILIFLRLAAAVVSLFALL